MGFNRLPNGLGNVSRLSGNRRKPWRARRTIGYEVNDELKTVKQVYATIGYFETKKEALESLISFSGKDIEKEKVFTFKDILDMFEKEDEEKFYKYHRHCVPYMKVFMKRNFKEITATDYETILNSDKVPRTTKNKVKQIINGMYKVAIRKEIVEKNVISNASIKIDLKPQIERTQFSKEEVETFDGINDIMKYVLFIGVYCGMRESEIFSIEKKNVHLSERYFTGGLKTDAGKNRIVPIHKKLVPLFEELMKQEGDFLIPNYGGHIDSGKYRLRTFLENNYAGHTSHDMRVTFITNAYNSGINHMIVQKIVGHKTGDITMDTYTKILPKDLVAEIDKYEVF